MILKCKAEEAAKDVLKAFENPNDLPKPLAKLFIHRKDGSPCRNWSWRNQLIIAIHGHEEARGYKQWEIAGRRVRKGEKSLRILKPLIKKVYAEEEEEERSLLYGFSGVPVFGVVQTEGDPLPYRHDETQKWLQSLPFREVAESWGLTVEAYNGTSANILGQYRSGSAIALGVTNLATWAHELVHAADHQNGTLKGRKICKETVAELGGAVLLKILGSDHEADIGGCWEYINRFAKKEKTDVLDVCGKLLDRTCAAVALILDTAEELAAAELASNERNQR